MQRVFALLPDAIVCVAEEERADYLGAVDHKKIICHPNLKGLPRIRNWINKTIQEDCLVMIDDDLQGVIPCVQKQKLITDPDIIWLIFENSHRVCEDLDIGVFCWNRSRNSFLVSPELMPIRLVCPMAASYGLRGPARERKFAETAREDVDFVMLTLMEDRILSCDVRWYFEHGRSFSGRGGNVGVLDDGAWHKSSKEMYAKWGKFLGRSVPGFRKRESRIDPMSIRVQRRNPSVKINN